jgi:deazaflavin-dependent oxidoreductase (nitroreductase family)
MTLTARRPSWSERRLVAPLLQLLVGRLGLDIDQVRMLEVRGRHSGAWHTTTPVKVLTHAGQRYLVSLHGNSDWVRNLRVHPQARLRLGRDIQQVTAVELPDDLKAPVLEAYLAATRRRTTRQLLTGTDTRAQDHPVFQLQASP